MPQPVPGLRAMRAMAGDGGGVMVMDENVGHEFTAPGDELERLMYGFSTLVCLPDGMSHPDSVGTGTVMRPAVFEGYAKEAGFGGWRSCRSRRTSGASTGSARAPRVAGRVRRTETRHFIESTP